MSHASTVLISHRLPTLLRWHKAFSIYSYRFHLELLFCTTGILFSSGGDKRVEFSTQDQEKLSAGHPSREPASVRHLLLNQIPVSSCLGPLIHSLIPLQLFFSSTFSFLPFIPSFAGRRLEMFSFSFSFYLRAVLLQYQDRMLLQQYLGILQHFSLLQQYPSAVISFLLQAFLADFHQFLPWFAFLSFLWQALIWTVGFCSGWMLVSRDAPAWTSSEVRILYHKARRVKKPILKTRQADDDTAGQCSTVRTEKPWSSLFQKSVSFWNDIVASARIKIRHNEN